MKTYIAKEEKVLESRRWYIVDAKDQILGRMASQIASVLKGKHKPIYSPHQDVGDFVVVVNAEKIKVTGNKLKEKMYHRHSGYPGGQKGISLQQMLQKQPEKVIELAVKRMLPKNSLGRRMYLKLKVYAGPDHPHKAQLPEQLELKQS